MQPAEKKPSDAKKEKGKTAETEKKEKVPVPLTNDEFLKTGFRLNCRYLLKSAESAQSRLVQRALKTTGDLRRRLTSDRLYSLVQTFLFEASPHKRSLLDAVAQMIQKDGLSLPSVTPKNDTPGWDCPPEIDYYFAHIVLHALYDRQMYSQVSALAQEFIPNTPAVFNRRSLDFLLSKALFWYTQSAAELGNFSLIRPYTPLSLLSRSLTKRAPTATDSRLLPGFTPSRRQVLALYRTSCLRSNAPCQAVLLNQLLHQDLLSRRYEDAINLQEKTVFPENVSNDQLLRYLYLSGFLDALSLRYDEAKKKISLVYRKIPREGAVGFKRQVAKLLVVIYLLCGETPDRLYFTESSLRDVMKPYLSVTQAVRRGDPAIFRTIFDSNRSVFEADSLDTILQRVSHTVVKTGLRRINKSYECISLSDVSQKLNFKNERDAFFVCSKVESLFFRRQAIREGVLSAEIDYVRGILICKANPHDSDEADILQNLQKRIAFCHAVHCESVKCLRYPLNPVYKPLETEEMEEEDEDDYEGFDDGDFVGGFDF